MTELLTSRWIWVEGFALLMSGLFWVAALGFAIYLRRRDGGHEPLSAGDASRLQNRVYKRFGSCLLVFGAVGGFLPSVFIYATTGDVWSVNRQAPHSLVDGYLLVHIPLAVLWALLVAAQLWSGQVPRRRVLHIRLGWLTLAAGVLGVGVIGGWLWPLVNDFADGFDSPNAGAGIYTMSMGVGVVVNGVLAGYYARRRDLARHKDHVLMALFWSMDPGIHRLNMWLMRLFGGDVWAPEQTHGLGIAIAKLPANLTLIAWALAMAVLARRLNGVIWSNVAGQFALWCFGTLAVVGAFQTTALAWGLVLVSTLAALVVWTRGRSHPVLASAVEATPRGRIG